MSFGTFTLIKNERPWITAHLNSWLPWVDQMVFFDGFSTDGTLEEIKKIKKDHVFGSRITLVEGKDPANLEGAYVDMFNEAIRMLDTDYAAFVHPDMILADPGNIQNLGPDIAYYSHMKSYAGELGGQLYEITKGRAASWKHIYRLRRPDLGLHYHGHYGAFSEDCYFSKITGNEHAFYGTDYNEYPYKIGDSGIKIDHYSDVRPFNRRVDRMMKCLLNQGKSRKDAISTAAIHPRVTFKDGYGFKFEPREWPIEIIEANKERVSA